MKQTPFTQRSKEDRCHSRGQKMRYRRFKGHIISADVTCFCSVNLSKSISTQTWRVGSSLVQCFVLELCSSWDQLLPLTKSFIHFFGHCEGPPHIHHWIIACRRDALKHIFNEHLKALPPVEVIWYHLYLGLRRFRALAFVVKGTKENKSFQLFRKGRVGGWCCVPACCTTSPIKSELAEGWVLPFLRGKTLQRACFAFV